MGFDLWALRVPQPCNQLAFQLDGRRTVPNGTAYAMLSLLFTYKYLIYAVQQDTQSVLMSEFIHHLC